MSDEVRKHCHAQIEYETFNGQVESMWGFDPTSKETREFLHKSLDEFLDMCLIPKFNRTEEKAASNRDRFIVFGSVDSH
jgi:hypothetical protein